MISRSNREAGRLKKRPPETLSDFYDTTRGLLREAAAYRDAGKLRRSAIRLAGERFEALSESRKEELSELYSEASVVCRMGSVG